MKKDVDGNQIPWQSLRMSNTNQLPQTAMKMILETAVEFLANKHSVTIEQITEALREGNAKIWSQLNTLLEVGVETAKEAA